MNFPFPVRLHHFGKGVEFIPRKKRNDLPEDCVYNPMRQRQ